MENEKYKDVLKELEEIIEQKDMTIRVQKEAIKDLQRALARAEYHLNPVGKVNPDRCVKIEIR